MEAKYLEYHAQPLTVSCCVCATVRRAKEEHGETGVTDVLESRLFLVFPGFQYGLLD